MHWPARAALLLLWVGSATSAATCNNLNKGSSVDLSDLKASQWRFQHPKYRNKRCGAECYGRENRAIGQYCGATNWDGVVQPKDAYIERTFESPGPGSTLTTKFTAVSAYSESQSGAWVRHMAVDIRPPSSSSFNRIFELNPQKRPDQFTIADYDSTLKATTLDEAGTYTIRFYLFTTYITGHPWTAYCLDGILFKVEGCSCPDLTYQSSSNTCIGTASSDIDSCKCAPGCETGGSANTCKNCDANEFKPDFANSQCSTCPANEGPTSDQTACQPLCETG